MSNTTANNATETKMSGLVQINHRSGNSITAWFDKLDINTEEGNVVGASWTLSADQRGLPVVKIINIGVNNIESIVQLDAVYHVQEDVIQ